VSDAWTPAWIGLGSNLDDPKSQLERAFAAVERLRGTRLYLRSRLYRNPPMGPQDQPDYINAVAGLLTQLSARDLLQALQGIEHGAGRDRAAAERWGPRPLDLDILTYGQQAIEQPGLHVPHPGIAERNFVLLPLLELAPGLQIPGLAPLSSLVVRLGDDNLEPLD
jgi:2-amino-4-hydroxy-6-hydroxymethyldihydropteridine diphosphokinase